MHLHSTVLENGLRVFVHQVPHVRTVTMSIWIDQGSQDEPTEVNGINHFTEHLVVKQLDPNIASPLVRGLLDRGAQFNGTTTKEFTYYHITAMKDHLQVGLQALWEMVREVQCSREDLETQRAVILEEYNILHNSVNQIHERFGQAFWGDTSLGQFVIGREEVVRGLTLDQICSHADACYRADNASIVVVGSCDWQKVFQTVEEIFGGWKDGTRFPPPPQVMYENNIQLIRTESDQVTLALGVNGVPFSSQDRFAVEMIAHLLGGGANSRLFRTIREERGLAYSVNAFANTYELAGVIGTAVKCSGKAVPEVIPLVLEAFNDLRTRPVPEAELQSAKETLATSAFMMAENTLNLMRLIGRGAMLGINYSINAHLQAIRSLTPEDIQRVAKRLFRKRSLAAAAIGDVSGDSLLAAVTSANL